MGTVRQMMDNKKSIKAATKNLAQFTQQLAQEVQAELQKTNKSLESVANILAGVVRMLGAEAVQASVEEMKREANANMTRQQTEAVAALVEKKVLLPAEKVEAPAGFVVGVEEVPGEDPRRVQFEMASINPQFAELYVGKTVGEKVVAGESTLTIEAIYTVDRTAFEALMAEQAKAAAQPEVVEAPAPAAEPVAAAEPVVEAPAAPEVAEADIVIDECDCAGECTECACEEPKTAPEA